MTADDAAGSDAAVDLASDDFTWLVLLAAVMFTASFASGLVPLAFTLTEKRMNALAAYGAGILVGTALIVILPEGVAVRRTRAYSGSGRRGGRLTSGNLVPQCHQRMQTLYASGADVAGYIGPALILGFLVMFLIDSVGDGHGGGHAHAHGASDIHAHGVPALPSPSTPPPMFTASFLGLLVHNVADGIAMGAASAGVNKSLETIVFLAIIMHKAPAAFGLSALLLHEGHTRKVRGQGDAAAGSLIGALIADALPRGRARPLSAAGPLPAGHLLGGGASVVAVHVHCARLGAREPAQERLDGPGAPLLGGLVSVCGCRPRAPGDPPRARHGPGRRLCARPAGLPLDALRLPGRPPAGRPTRATRR